MNRPSAITPHERRLPKSGNAALVAGAAVQVVLGVEFLLTGLSKVVNWRYLADFSAFVSAGSGAHYGVIAPLIQALVIPNLGVAAPALRRFMAQPEGPPASAAPEPGRAPQAVRAQLLATEHWSLLATRSTTQSEVLSRITTFLMLVSSSIVGLALIGQVTKFDRRFIALALVLLGMLVVIGTLTQMRVGAASLEDLALVIGMNRLRAGYVELDPGIEKYFVTSPHDDTRGVWQTYNPLTGPRALLQPLASSGSFITFVTSGLAGAFGGLVAVALGAPGLIVGLVAAACGLAFIGLSTIFGLRQFLRLKRTILFPARSPQS